MPILKPNPGRQTFALQQPYSIREILYGGARGGGKTFAGLMWMSEYYEHPDFAGLVIRKNSDDLADWIERAKRMYRGLGATFTGNPVVIRFPAGGRIRTGHLKDQRSLDKYLGQEYQKILIEELTQISSEVYYRKVTSSCRTSIPELRPQIFCTTNPGGIGHLWVKKLFIDPHPANEAFIGEDGIKRIYIPATIDDNPQLIENDPNYVKNIEAWKDVDEALYRAWRFGDWDIFVGQVFSEFRQTMNGKPWHVIPKLPFNVMAPGVKRYIGMDWGFGQDPAALEWIAVIPPNHYGVRHYYIYREMTDLRVEAEEWIRRVADVVNYEPIDGFILPADAYFHKEQVNTIADRMAYELKRIQQFNPTIKIPLLKGVGLTHSQRVNRQLQLHSLLATQVDGEPGIQIIDKCRKLIETIPSLPFSETDPETVETKSGTPDHWYDAATYALYYITDQPDMRAPRLSEDDILQESYGEYQRADFRPEYQYENNDDWRQR